MRWREPAETGCGADPAPCETASGFGRLASCFYATSFAAKTARSTAIGVGPIDFHDVHARHLIAEFAKADELPFDFQRRRMSVVLDRGNGTHLLITKGAVEEVFSVCDHYVLGAAGGPLDPSHFDDAKREMDKFNNEGFRVVAVAFKEISTPKAAYTVADETGLTLLGYIAFLDPPKDTVAASIAQLNRVGVAVKIFTGDNDLITRTICRQVNLAVSGVVVGHDIEAMSDEELGAAAEQASVFAKLTPTQKARVIDALTRLIPFPAITPNSAA